MREKNLTAKIKTKEIQFLTTKGSGTEKLFFAGSGYNFSSLGGRGANEHR